MVSVIAGVLYVAISTGCIFLGTNGLFSLPVAIIVAVAVTGLTVFVDLKVRKKKTNSQSKSSFILEYFLLGISTFCIYSFMSVLFNDSYAIHHFGEYSGESAFFSCFEVIPEFVDTLLLFIIPLILFICVVFARRFLFLFSSVFCLLGTLSNNTIRIFGEYYIVAASGNKSRRFNDVTQFAEIVEIALFVFAGVCLVISLIDIFVKIKNSKKLLLISLLTLLIGGMCTFFAYNTYNKGTTFDVEQLKTDIYVETKEGSDRFLQENFHNDFGSATTKCAHPGCENSIAYSGDTNCCVIHSNRCENCGDYVDGDAVYCMSCIENALK